MPTGISSGKTRFTLLKEHPPVLMVSWWLRILNVFWPNTIQNMKVKVSNQTWTKEAKSNQDNEKLHYREKDETVNSFCSLYTTWNGRVIAKHFIAPHFPPSLNARWIKIWCMRFAMTRKIIRFFWKDIILLYTPNNSGTRNTHMSLAFEHWIIFDINYIEFNEYWSSMIKI